MKNKDTIWSLRVHVDHGDGFAIGYDTEKEAQEAYSALYEMLNRVSQQMEAIR